MHDHLTIIGILGGICSGKSAVSSQFAKNGAAIFRADNVAHDLLDDEDVRNKLIEAFGTCILDADNMVNRKKLANIVFSCRANTDKINSIVHPAVTAKCEQFLSEITPESGIRAVVIDAPLLIEAGWADMCDLLIFVECDDKIRARRAAGKCLDFEKDIKNRENFQISLDKKRNLAHIIVDNNSGLSAMAEQVDRIFSTI